MRPWQFSRPKGPGFGISKNFYLTVLSSKAVLPSILEVVNPKGEQGAAVGFGAPLSNAPKEALAKPMEQGAYVMASKDQKTVLKVLVISKDEAGYDPETFANSPRAVGADPELLARMRGTWTMSQFAFEAHDAAVYPALDFLLSVTARLAELSEGVVADAISERYLLPGQVMRRDRLDPKIDAREHVSVQFKLKPEGLYAYTLGMQKFVLPEFEMSGLSEPDQQAAQTFLFALCQSVLLGNAVEAGDKVGSKRLPFQVSAGGFDRAMWEGIPVVELLPPTRSTPSEALAAWTAESIRPL